MRLVIDTNVMVESITNQSPYHKLFLSLVNGKNELVISNEIYLEYFEIFGRIYSKRTLSEIQIFFNYSPQIIRIDPHFHFRLIQTDLDDNKFVDCALCGNCHFLVTSDRHFDILNEIEFPKLSIISPPLFIQQYL